MFNFKCLISSAFLNYTVLFKHNIHFIINALGKKRSILIILITCFKCIFTYFFVKVTCVSVCPPVTTEYEMLKLRQLRAL